MFWLVKSWQVSSCGKFMQHLETWLLIAETDRVLCNVVNQWSVLAILLFAKNADNENKKCLKKSKSKKSRLFPGPFLCLVFLAECTRLTAVKKWREILGNRGINLQVFICSCTLCVPAMFQDVGSLRQNLDGQEMHKNIRLFVRKGGTFLKLP